MAAESHADRSIKDPLAFLNTNVVGTANLLNAGLNFGVTLAINYSIMYPQTRFMGPWVIQNSF